MEMDPFAVTAGRSTDQRATVRSTISEIGPCHPCRTGGVAPTPLDTTTNSLNSSRRLAATTEPFRMSRASIPVHCHRHQAVLHVRLTRKHSCLAVYGIPPASNSCCWCYSVRETVCVDVPGNAPAATDASDITRCHIDCSQPNA